MAERKKAAAVKTLEVANGKASVGTPGGFKRKSNACRVCGCTDERDAVLCDGCDGAFHLDCHKAGGLFRKNTRQTLNLLLLRACVYEHAP
jgi:hypothetical protein